MNTPDKTRLHVNATRLSPPPTLDDVLRNSQPLALWVDSKVAFVAFGLAKRITTVGDNAGHKAALQWKTIANNAQVDGNWDNSIRATLPLAMGSFGFFPHTPGTLIIPERIIAFSRTDTANVWDVRQSFDEALVTQTPATWTTDGIDATNPGHIVEGKGVDADAWAHAVENVIDLMHQGQAKKVVMARSVRIGHDRPINIGQLASRLHDEYPTCWTFAVDGLVGASPEMLCDMHNGQVHCLVLAGTAAPDDGQQLMQSAKDREEHRLAVKSATDVLEQQCSSIDIKRSPELLILPNVSHLATHIYGQADNRTSLDIAWALHPTAAVCGTPTAHAYRIIADNEHLDRGRYAGPVGWIDAHGDGQWAIALRCGQIDPDNPKKIDIIAGGGIMPDSIPQREVDETRRKMRPMLHALGVNATGDF